MLSRIVFRSCRLPVRRLVFTASRLSNEALPKQVSKEALVNLRKKTGYSYSNCRKALLQFGEDNLTEAEKWLNEEAKKEGWAKAQKLSNRQTSQGLVAVSAQNNVAAILELNCETDFVGRSKEFKDLVEEITLAILEHGKKLFESKAPTKKTEFVSIPIDESLLTTKNRSIREAIELAIGQMRENIVIKKAEAIISNPAISVQACTHPQDGSQAVQMGRFASVVGIMRNEEKTKFPTSKLAQQLCQHVIGMRPEVLGTPDTRSKDQPEPLDENKPEAEEEVDELNAFAKVQSTKLDEDETQILRQTFMFSPSMTVHEYLESHSATLSWFLRLELGEGSKAS